MAENLYRRGALFGPSYVPVDQQGCLGRKEFAWSLVAGAPKVARTRLAAKLLEFEAMVSPPGPHRRGLETRYNIPVCLPAAEAL